MNAFDRTAGDQVHRADVAKAIDKDPIATYRAYRGNEADHFFTIPDYMRPGLVRYVLVGIKPGSFLTSLLAGEMELAKVKADDTNAKLLDTYVELLQSAVPAMCWGTPDDVRAWCENGGLVGRLNARTASA